MQNVAMQKILSQFSESYREGILEPYEGIAKLEDVRICGWESGSTGISNIRSAAFDYQQIGYTLQSNRTINTQERGSFMLVATILCLKERRGSYVHFYV